MKRYALGYGSKSLRKFWIILLTFVAVGLTVSAVMVHRVYNENLQPASASQRSVLITVPSGASAQEIGKKLQEHGVIKAAWAFEWYVRTNDVRDRLQAGTYNLRPNQSISEIVNILTQGKVATDLVTILPGQRLDQIRNSLINNAGFSAEDVDKALNPNNYANHPALADKPTGANLEGYLYPDSYQKTADTTAETIIKASLDQMQQQLTPNIRAAFVRHGLTVHEGVTLASIVEQEVGNAKDKPIVAQVFLLRREKGMQLGSDVTAFYGAIKAGQEPSVFYDTPYNTRLHTGMPPGPISNVSKSSLESIANPATSDYVYFVAGDDGVTYFSHTEKEHEALTAKHCKKLCQ